MKKIKEGGKKMNRWMGKEHVVPTGVSVFRHDSTLWSADGSRRQCPLSDFFFKKCIEHLLTVYYGQGPLLGTERGESGEEDGVQRKIRVNFWPLTIHKLTSTERLTKLWTYMTYN